MSKFFKDLKRGLKEIAAYKQGKITLHSEFVEVSPDAKCYTDYEDYLITELKEDKHECAAYLLSAAEDEDKRVFLLALHHIHTAYKDDMARLLLDLQNQEK